MLTSLLITALITAFTVSLCLADEQPWLVESRDRPAVPSRERMLWADSVRHMTLEEILGESVIEIEAWANEAPKELAGRFLLIKVWATWCPPCRRSLPLLEFFHEKYKDELIVVSIVECNLEALKSMAGPVRFEELKAPIAIDTHRRFANALGVYGIPHAVLIDPIFGAVLWEGMPTQIGYELSDEVMARFLANLRNPNVRARLPERPAFEFRVMPPDPNREYRPAPSRSMAVE